MGANASGPLDGCTFVVAKATFHAQYCTIDPAKRGSTSPLVWVMLLQNSKRCFASRRASAVLTPRVTTRVRLRS
jgi:hypothetical protein